MKLHIATDEYSGSSDEERETKLEASAYRLVNLKNLSSVLSSIHKCEDGELNEHVLTRFSISLCLQCCE